nr:VOC family protein [Bacillus sp. THAF10]
MPVYQVRIARSTDQWEDVLAFYEKGVGLERIGSFENHDGYDGVMLGLPGASYHLEFTRHVDGHPCPAPTDDNLLVFYLTDQRAFADAKERMLSLGYHPVPPVNPYWESRGVTFRDPDGWRVVFCLGTGI